MQQLQKILLYKAKNNTQKSWLDLKNNKQIKNPMSCLARRRVRRSLDVGWEALPLVSKFYRIHGVGWE